MTAAMDWKSSRRFFVDKRQIQTKWAHEPDAKYRIAFMNRCLCVFWRALENIEKTQRVDFNHGWNMRKELNNLCEVGWELRGPGDMNSALEYLANYHCWTDPETDRYEGGTGKIFSRTLDVPEAFARFAEALDQRLAQLATDLRDYVKAAEAATTDASRNSWEGCQNNLKGVAGVISKVEDSLWLMDTVEVVKNDATKEFFKKTSKAIGKYGGTVGKFVDIAGRIDAVAKVSIKMKAATADIRGAEDVADAFAAMRATVDYLPVFGDYLAGALDAAPDLINAFKSSIARRTGAATRASHARNPSLTRAATCPLCLMPAAHPCKR